MHIYRIDEARNIEIRNCEAGEIPDGWEELPPEIDQSRFVTVVNDMPANIVPAVVEIPNGI